MKSALIHTGTAAALLFTMLLTAGVAEAQKGKPTRPDPLEPFRTLTPAALLKVAEKHEAAFHQVKRGDVIARLVERGTLESTERADLVCRLKATERGKHAAVIKWVIEDGELVKQGTKVLEFDDGSLREQLKTQAIKADQANAALAAAAEDLQSTRSQGQSAIRLAEIEVELAALAVKRYKGNDANQKKALELKAERAMIVAQRTKSQARANELQAAADLRVKKAILEAEQQRKKAIEDELQKCVLRSPQDGLAVYHVPEGHGRGADLVAVGETVREGQKLLRVLNLDKMGANLPVPEAQISRIRIGQKAEVRVDAYPDKILAAEVKTVSSVASPIDWRANVKVYPVQVHFTEKFADLKPGMRAQITLFTARKINVLYLPLPAVVRQGKDLVCFVKAGKELQARKVMTGASSDQLVEITAGIEDGDMVLRDPVGLTRRLRGEGDSDAKKTP